MPRRRKSGVQSESFAVRWHSIADPNTASVDIMSSPDPLNEPTISISSVAPPSTSRRVTRSQRSQRFTSLDDSPRKRTFELELGDSRSPQRLLVTVEAETDDMALTSGTRRKLFKSPIPSPTMRRHLEQTTITTVPLRESIEDELSTPRRRGRPRISNGTPMPTAGTKRRAGTPIRRSPRRQRTSKSAENTTGEVVFEGIKQATPTSARRGRPPKNRTVEPSSEIGTAKRGGRRRQALAPDELIEIVEEAAAERSSLRHAAQMSENDMDLIPAPLEAADDEYALDTAAAAASNADADFDMWMAAISPNATPRVATRDLATNKPEPQLDIPDEAKHPEREAESMEGDDYGYLAPAASDSSEYGPQNNDTIAQGEDFSMIFMDSIPSLQASLHGNSTFMPTAHDEDDLGDETHLIINNTLESLRQDVPQSDPMDTTDTILIPQPDVEEEPQQEYEPSSSARKESAAQPRLSLSPWWSRKPKKLGSSPLRHQVLKSSAKQAGRLSMMVEEGQVEVTPTRASKQTTAATTNEEDSNLYEDSFSEIPQEYLAAATPKHPHAIQISDDEDDEDDALEDARRGEEQHGEHLLGDEQEYEHLEGEPQAEAQEKGQAWDEEQDAEHQDEDSGAPEEHDFEMEENVDEAEAQYGATTAAISDTRRLPTPDQTPPQLDIEEEQLEVSEERSSVPAAVSSASAQGEEEQNIAEGMNENAQSPLQMQLAAEEPGPTIQATPLNQMSSPLQEPLSLTQDHVQDRSARPVLSSIVRAGRVLQSVTSDPPSPGDREKQLGSPFRSSGSKESLHLSKDNRLPSKSPQPASKFHHHQARASSLVQNDEAPANPLATNRNINKPTATSPVGKTRINRPSSRESVASSMRITPPSEGGMSWVEKEGPISPSLRGDNTLLEAAGLRNVKPRQTLSIGQVDGAVSETHEEDDDDLDIWDFEANRQTPRASRQQPFGGKVVPSVRKRGAALSPWAKKSVQRPLVTEKGSQQSQSARNDGVATAGRNTAEKEQHSLLAENQKEKEAESASKSNRFELSSFFSSPAAIPGMLAEKFLPSKAKPAPQLPAKQVEPKGAGKPVLPTSSMFPPVSQRETNPGNGPRLGIFSPVRPNRQPVEQASSPVTPERVGQHAVSEQQDSTPRQRQTTAVVQPSSSRATVTPPRMQLSHADIHKWTQETSHAGNDPPNPRRLLRPLPSKNASPKKSSLRSPLKPRTPGRVVEFTSSVLSPDNQAEAREQRRRAQAAVSVDPVGVPLPAPQEPPAATKNSYEVPEVVMSDAPPTESQPLLSQTIWSRRHWLFLDMLLQMRRHKPFEQQYERSSKQYLGRAVKSQGESMVLEQWHLDCVDAFKSEVGGWDEAVLAKRLFALILGEEQRRSGSNRLPRVMFH